VNTFLSSSQEALKEQYEKYAAEEIQPAAKDLDSGKASLKEFLQKLGQTGFLGLTIAKEYGGASGSFLEQSLFVEAACEYEAGLGLAISAHVQVVELLKRYGDDRQKSRYLPLLARGEAIGAFCLNEENAGSDYSLIESVATTKQESPKLNGKKIWVVNGEIASLLVVAAKDEETGKLSLWLVDAGDSKSAKVSSGPKKLGLRSASADEIVFTEAPLAEGSRLEGDAIEQIEFALDTAKTILAMASIGMTNAAMKLAVEHARTRQQFGKNIGAFQGVQWKLADMSTDLAAARMLALRAAWAFNESPEEFRKCAAMAKLLSSKTARFQTGEAIQVMGATGIVEGSPAERFYRDAKMMEICQGTSELQKVIIADELKV
jgi:alkylation response protein AidB-like acyl-CoA dehydrogenase